MGLDPTRPHRTSTLDYVVVGLALAVCLGLLAWAVFG